MLPTNQLSQIAKAVSKNGVQYYDVQLELIDHVATGIEYELIESNGANFNTLLQQHIDSWKKEWPFIVKAKSKQLQKKYYAMWKAAFVAFFSIPKIMLTLLLVIISYWAIHAQNNQQFVNAALHILNLINCLYAFGNGKIIGYNQQQKKQPLLSLVCLRKLSAITLIIPIFYLVLVLLNLVYDNHPPVPAVVYTLAISLFPIAVLAALAWRSVNISANQKIREQYAAAFS